MKEKWTKRRTKIEAWQRNSPAEIIKSDLDAIRTEFDQEHERLKKTIAEFSAELIILRDHSDCSTLIGKSLTPSEKSSVPESPSSLAI